MKKKFCASLLSLLFVLSTVFSLNATTTTNAATARDCDDNAIMRCGAVTTTELRQKYEANQNGDVQAIFAHYGVSKAMVGGSMKTGTVTRDGKVIVDGKTVATGAQSVGRQNISGSTAVTIAGKTYYQRPTSVSFRSESLSAFVFMDARGQYIGAVIQSCGNPVKATPTPPPAPEKPKAQPAAACVSIKANRIEKDRYSFDATASATNGATISQYVFTVRQNDQTTQTQTVAATATRASSETFTLTPGTYAASVTVKTSVGDKTSPSCTVKVTIPEPNKVTVCNPETGEIITVNEDQVEKYVQEGDEACEDIQVCELSTKNVITIKTSDFDETKHSKDLAACEEQPQVLPATGPAEFIGGSLALGSLTAGAYYWNASRRRLISNLLNR